MDKNSSGMYYNGDADFKGMFDGVFSSALAIRRNKCMENVGIFNDEAVSGIIGFCEFIPGGPFGR